MIILTELMLTSLREDQLLPLQRYDFTLAQWRGETWSQCVCGLSQRRKSLLESSSWVDGGVCCAVLCDCMCVHIRLCRAWGMHIT